jgi:hypothetical protein
MGKEVVRRICPFEDDGLRFYGTAFGFVLGIVGMLWANYSLHLFLGALCGAGAAASLLLSPLGPWYWERWEDCTHFGRRPPT